MIPWICFRKRSYLLRILNFTFLLMICVLLNKMLFFLFLPLSMLLPPFLNLTLLMLTALQILPLPVLITTDVLIINSVVDGENVNLLILITQVNTKDFVNYVVFVITFFLKCWHDYDPNCTPWFPNHQKYPWPNLTSAYVVSLWFIQQNPWIHIMLLVTCKIYIFIIHMMALIKVKYNGDSLSISNICKATLNFGWRYFHLHLLYHVPKIKANLISFYKFCVDNNVYFEFHSSFFLLKDRQNKSGALWTN